MSHHWGRGRGRGRVIKRVVLHVTDTVGFSMVSILYVT